jgi:hypothetical protein
MKINRLTTIIVACAAAVTLSAQTVSYDFTSDEGWSEGATLNGTNNFIAQTQWVSNDVAGAGHAFSGTDFTRAVLFNNFTFNVGDSFTLVADLRFVNAASINSKTTMFQFGLTDTLSPGANTPKVGMSVRPASTPIYIDANNSVLGNEIQALASKDQDVHTYTTVITKSATLDTFDVSIDFDNGAAGTSFTIVDSALYAASDVYPIFGNWQANAKGGIELNSFSSTFTAIPEPSTFAAMFGMLALAGAAARRKRTLA